MSVIWKYEIPLEGAFQVVVMPRNARIIHCAVQHERPCVWVTANPDAPMENRTFRLVATGSRFSSLDVGEYHGTFLLEGGALVLHLFEL